MARPAAGAQDEEVAGTLAMAEWVERQKDGKGIGEWFALVGIEDARLALDILKASEASLPLELATSESAVNAEMIDLARGVLRVWALPIVGAEIVEEHAIDCPATDTGACDCGLEEQKTA